MSKRWTHSECFEFFKTVPRNPRWSWSGQSVDGACVAVTLWQDRFTEQGRVYKSWDSDRPGEWRSRPGLVELIDNLTHARDRLNGEVSVILATARDKEAVPRSIERCFPHPTLKMRIVALDTEAGTFMLERIEAA